LGTISSSFFKTRHHGGFFVLMRTEANSLIFLPVFNKPFSAFSAQLLQRNKQPLNSSLSSITKLIELFSKPGGL
jgi:hypothetical protein